MTFLDLLNLPNCDFTQNWSGGKIIKFQQSQALTSHFESYWSIVPLLSSLKDCLIEISKYLTDYFKLKLASSIHCILNDFLAMKIMKGWNKNGTATTYQKPDDFESFIKAQLSEYEYENSSAATPAIYAWNSQASLWSDTKLYCN